MHWLKAIQSLSISLSTKNARLLSSSSRQKVKVDPSMGTFLSHKPFGRFHIQNESEHAAILTQPPFDSSFPIPNQFGGEITANVILAASSRLPSLSSLRLMSLSMDYILPGKYHKSRDYHVFTVGDTNRFTHVNVRLKQGDHLIINANLAFHSLEGDAKSLHYFPDYPEHLPHFDQLVDDRTLFKKLKTDPNVSKSSIGYATSAVFALGALGMTGKPCNPKVYFRNTKEPSTSLSFWFRCKKGEVENVMPDIEHLEWSSALLSYMADFRIMGSALRQNPEFHDGRMTTLQQSIWFCPNNQLKTPTDWVLYDTNVKMSTNNTILTEGRMWNDKKQLLAISQQQGLCRAK